MDDVFLSVIIPMYNSEDIKRNINEANEKLKKLKVSYEIVLVDDGSLNDCFHEAKKITIPNLKVVGYKQNKGKGNAIKYGFQFARGKHVAFVDSGRDIDPSQLSLFIKIMNKERADIVVGSKKHPESDVHYPLMRRIMSYVYQLVNKIFFNLDIKDTQVGLKLFKKSILDKVMPKIAIKKFAFDLELLVIAKKEDAKIVEAPVKIKYRFGSTINAKAVFWMLWDTLAIFYRDKILRYYSK